MNRSPEWLQLASCRDHDPDLWWEKEDAQPGKFGGHSGKFKHELKATAICLACPVLTECRVQVDEDEAVFGMEECIQAAETPKERKARRRADRSGGGGSELNRMGKAGMFEPPSPEHLTEAQRLSHASGRWL